MPIHIFVPRRRFISALALGSAAFMVRGAFADDLSVTPSQTEGPFYPDKLPLDQDNDLIIVTDSITPAVGEITHLHGKVTDVKGAPVKDAVVEIWQVDNKGVYIHTKDSGKKSRDTNFQGFGKFQTGADGEYRFRTIKPVPYPGRPPHIHMKVKRGDKELLTTQCYIKGHPGNEKDGVLRGMKDESSKAALMVDFAPVKDSKIGELSAKFDIVLAI